MALAAAPMFPGWVVSTKINFIDSSISFNAFSFPFSFSFSSSF